MTRPGDRLGRTARAFLATLAIGIVAVMITARALKPDLRGFGTHTQMGLGPCAFRELTKKPCPACGMTTAFAWTARGRIDRAWSANPAGSVIAPACILIAPWLIFVAISGRPRPFRTVEEPLVIAVLAGVAISLLTWAVRLLLMS
jgi:hypothetical protein